MTGPAVVRARRMATERLGSEPTVVARAPGRVNLIGEHTDYNDGFVMPFAIDRDTAVAVRARDDSQVVLVSESQEGEIAFPAAEVGSRLRGWGAYAQGVLRELRREGVTVPGFDGFVASDVPVGAGLSSSAALEVAVGLAATRLAGEEAEPAWLAAVAQRAEEHWVGVPCGIMDQLAVAASRRGTIMRLDCRDLTWQSVAVPEGLAVLVLDTGTRRELSNSAYQQRRAQCAEAAAELGVASLREVSDLSSVDRLTPTLAARARHVVSENQRVLATAAALTGAEAARAGAHMDASHASLRDDFEVSTPELDAMVAAAREQPGCHGARLTGAGFGGCAVALVELDRVATMEETIALAYARRTGQTATVHRYAPADGAGLA